MTWSIVKILDIRETTLIHDEIEEKELNYDEKISVLNYSDFDGTVQNLYNENDDVKMEQTTVAYEYYIHYIDEGEERRLDRWVTEQYLKVDPELMSSLESSSLEINSGKVYMPN